MGGEPEPGWVAKLRREYGRVGTDPPGTTRADKRKPEGQHPQRKRSKGEHQQAMQRALVVNARGLIKRGELECVVDIGIMDMRAGRGHRTNGSLRNLTAPDPTRGSGAAGGGGGGIGRGDTLGEAAGDG